MISLHYPSDRVTRFRCANTIIYIQGIPGSYGYRSLEMILIYKLQQIFWPRIISDTSTSEKLYGREIKMYFYLAMVGFEPTPTSTAAPSNTETTVIPSRPLRSLNKELSWPRFMLDFSALPVGYIYILIMNYIYYY